MSEFLPDLPAPDRAPGCWTIGETVGAPTARVRYRPFASEVWRTKPDGSSELVTVHWTRRSAERARDEYLRTGRVIGRAM